MKHFANLPKLQRADFFVRYEQRTEVHPVIVEKDFWVVWLLARIFSLTELGNAAVFKGGTSLSKVFGAIDRFSEDIDVGISPESLGWDEVTLTESSKNKWTEKLRPNLEAACAERVETLWLPRLESEAVRVLGAPPAGRTWLRYALETSSHSPVIHFDYPGALARGGSYITRSVKLEFGSLADQRPTGEHGIHAMIKDLAPGVFEDVDARVVALEIERTFWEKATILHAEYHRPAAKPQPARYARHYADFAALWRHPAALHARSQLDLLERVRQHKARFFASGWANYAAAVPGTLRLLPPESRWRELRADYAAMQPMFIGEPLRFSEILSILREAEQVINET